MVLFCALLFVCAHAELVNVARYPVRALSSELGRVMIAEKRLALATEGVALFPDFLTPEALAAAVRATAEASAAAFATNATHNAYQRSGLDATRSPQHVRNVPMRTTVASVAFDELPRAGVVRRVYDDDDVLALVAAVTGQDALFRLDDPLGAASINVFREEWEHAWHYDEAEFTTTLALQQPLGGGYFEHTRRLRASGDELVEQRTADVVNAHSRYQVRPAPSDSPPSAQAAEFEPGTLMIFAGRYSLHRVSRVHGARERLVAVLCYADRPGFRNTPAVQRMFWGREALETQQAESPDKKACLNQTSQTP